MSKNRDFEGLNNVFKTCGLVVKGHKGQGQRSWVKVKRHVGQGQIRIPKKGRWTHNNVKLLHFLPFLHFEYHIQSFST